MNFPKNGTNNVAKKPEALEKPGIWLSRLKNLETEKFWKKIEKQIMLNSFYTLSNEISIWHKKGIIQIKIFVIIDFFIKKHI